MVTRTTKNAIVLVTGAASGMGLLYARRAAAEGARAVVLWDVDGPALEAAAADIRQSHPAVSVVVDAIDITDQGAIESAATKVLRATGVPDVLVNNAGIVRGRWFWEHDARRDIEATMAVNTIAPMQITRTFLPAMMADASRPRRILNIASAAGLFSTPRMSVYAASKAGMIGWSDTLRLELRAQGHGQIKVTTVTPSFVSTGMFAGAKAPLLTPILPPEQVVSRVWTGMLAGRARVVLPTSVYIAIVLRGVLPVAPFDWLAQHVIRIYGSMDQFTGRAATTGEHATP